MLIEFRVENHCSIRTEQILSTEVGRGGDDSDPRPRKVEGHDTPLLPVVAIYGANASGKSNVLSAFDFMCDAVLNSYLGWTEERGGGVPRIPFAWKAGADHPTTFETTMLINNIRCEYGFVCNDKTILEEWLFAWPRGKKTMLFERDSEKIDVGIQLEKSSELIRLAKETNRANSLFLSVAWQLFKFRNLWEIYHWFNDSLSINCKYIPNYPRSLLRRGIRPRWRKYPEDKATLEKITDLIRHADLGIHDIKRQVRVSKGKTEGRTFEKVRFLFQHSKDDRDGWIRLGAESKGTQTLFWLATPMIRALNDGGLVLIDELESSLHPLIGNYIVNLFNNPETNPKNAQLIFTTHDTNLLAPTFGEPALRRDQVWFTEKDATGATKLYPLTDFKPRKEENLERGYLQGRYGAIPFLGDLNKLAEPEDVASKS